MHLKVQIITHLLKAANFELELCSSSRLVNNQAELSLSLWLGLSLSTHLFFCV
jgi:hypothetical protein